MRVSKLIALLQKQPPHLRVRVCAPSRDTEFPGSQTLWQVQDVSADTVMIGYDEGDRDEDEAPELDYCVLLNVSDPYPPEEFD